MPPERHSLGQGPEKEVAIILESPTRAAAAKAHISADTMAPTMELVVLQTIDLRSVILLSPRISVLPIDEQFQVLREFVRFLCLKIKTSDYEATVLAPSPLVDAFWTGVILKTRIYQRLHNLLANGSFIHHQPNGPLAVDRAALELRYKTTLSYYRHHFGEDPPKSVWPPTVVEA